MSVLKEKKGLTEAKCQMTPAHGVAITVRMRTTVLSHITPAPWCGHDSTHAHNRITRAGIKQPWTAVLGLTGAISCKLASVEEH